MSDKVGILINDTSFFLIGRKSRHLIYLIKRSRYDRNQETQHNDLSHDTANYKDNPDSNISYSIRESIHLIITNANSISNNVSLKEIRDEIPNTSTIFRNSQECFTETNLTDKQDEKKSLHIRHHIYNGPYEVACLLE